MIGARRRGASPPDRSQARSSAWRRSAMRSSTPSMPTDRRTSAGSTSSGEPGDRHVGHRGRDLDQRLHAAQRFGQGEQARPLGDRDRPFGRAELSRRRGQERDHPADPRVVHLGHVRPLAQERGHGRGVRRRGAPCAGAACAARAARGSSPAAPGTAPIAFCRKRSRSATASSEVTASPRIVSEWPARYFVAEWKTMSAPIVSGRWRAGDANVLSTTISGRRPPSAARRSTVAATAAMSTTLSSGFVGVSNQTSRVRSDSASQSTSGPAARSTYEVVDTGALADLLEVAVRAAVDVVPDDDLVARPRQLGDRRRGRRPRREREPVARRPRASRSPARAARGSGSASGRTRSRARGLPTPSCSKVEVW